MIIKDGQMFYTLREAAATSRYSADYFRVRIFQKKLKGVKIGRGWYTTKEWLADYTRNYAPSRLPEIAEVEEERRELPAAAGGAVTPAFEEVQAVPAAARRKFFETEILRRPDFKTLAANLRAHFSPRLAALPLLASLAFLLIYPVAATPLTWSQVTRRLSDGLGSFFIEVRVPEPEEVPELVIAALGRGVRRAVELPGGIGAGLLRGGERFSRLIAPDFASGGETSGERPVAAAFGAIKRFFVSPLAGSELRERIWGFLGPGESE